LSSSVTGDNISLIKTFLKILPKPLPSLMVDKDLEYQVEEVFCGTGIFIVFYEKISVLLLVA
jgi:3-hydroxymyristoyl/3-hydroxydecanoyl-(acyl carrier protein) dehydratase